MQFVTLQHSKQTANNLQEEFGITFCSTFSRREMTRTTPKQKHWAPSKIDTFNKFKMYRLCMKSREFHKVRNINDLNTYHKIVYFLIK
jgi:hypothetical protein